MAKALDIPDLDADTVFRDAAARAVEVRTEELFDHAEGVLDLDDIERVHDMRVASRRLRAVLEIFGPCFPKRQLRSALADVKQLAERVGERRDPDVAVSSLEQIGAGLTSDDAPGLDSLIAELNSERRAANEDLAATLEETQRSGLQVRLMALAAEARRT